MLLGGDAVAAAAARAAINDANAKAAQAFTNRDRAAWVAAYTEDATVLTPASVVTGRNAIDSSLGPSWESTRDSTFTASWRADTIEVHGDFAYEVGQGTGVRMAKGATPADTLRTRYITFWRKGSDGAWRVSRDFTVDVPKPKQ